MRQLPKLAKGGVLTKEIWDTISSIIDSNFREVRIQPGVGYTVTNSSGGVSLNVATGSKSSAPNLPFRILTRISGGDLYAGVAPGVLYKEINPSSTLAITGLLASSNPEATDPGWVSIGYDTKFWLKYTPALYGSPASAVIEHDQLSSTSSFDETADAWTTSSVLEGDYDSDGVFLHQTSRIIIGTIASATREIDQTVTTDLMLQPFCILGRACHYFAPAWW